MHVNMLWGWVQERKLSRRAAWRKWASMKGVQLKRLHHRAVLRQMEAANRLSYAVIDDMLFQGVVWPHAESCRI